MLATYITDSTHRMISIPKAKQGKRYTATRGFDTHLRTWVRQKRTACMHWGIWRVSTAMYGPQEHTQPEFLCR